MIPSSIHTVNRDLSMKIIASLLLTQFFLFLILFLKLLDNISFLIFLWFSEELVVISHFKSVQEFVQDIYLRKRLQLLYFEQDTYLTH